MFYHNCKNHGQIYFDLSEKIRMLSGTVGISQNGLKISTVSVVEMPVENSQPKPLCIECNKIIPSTEIVSYCGVLGHGIRHSGQWDSQGSRIAFECGFRGRPIIEAVVDEL